MITKYSLYVRTRPSELRIFVKYQVDINDNDKLVSTGTLTPDELAMAKIIKYIYEKHGGWPKDFTLYNETNGGNMGCPGIFGNISGPKEIPSPNYINIERATEQYNYFANLYDEQYIPYSSPENLMYAHNHLEDQLIEDIKRRKDKRRELLNKVMGVWNISSDGVVHRCGIDQYDENSLC